MKRTRIRELAVACGLAVIAVVFQLLSHGRFFSADEMSGATNIAAAVGTIGIGVAFLMISGEFDLSVSAVYALAPIIVAELTAHGWPGGIAFFAAMTGAAAVGLVNGVITVQFRIPSFIATLGTLFILTGLNFLWTAGYALPLSSHAWIFTILGGSLVSFFAMPFVWMILIGAGFWWVLERTRYGNWSLASGSRNSAARAMGVPVARVKMINFIACSALAGLAGCAQFAQLGVVSSGYGQNYNLLAIVAAVLGGTSLYGITGSVAGTVIGALILGTLETGLVLVGAPSSWYTSFVGVVLVLTVVFNTRFEWGALGAEGGQK